MEETSNMKKKTSKLLILFILVVIVAIIISIVLLVMKYCKDASNDSSGKDDDKVAISEEESENESEEESEEESKEVDSDDEDDKDDKESDKDDEKDKNEKNKMVVEIDREDYFGLEIKESDACVSEEEFEKYIESDLQANGAKELNDDFVKDVYSYLGISTVEEYKVEYKKTVEQSKRYNVLWPVIMDNVTVISYDSNELKSRADEMYEYYEYTYSQTGEGIDAALDEAGITKEEFYKNYCEEPVKEEIKFYYIRDYIAKEENITFTEEEFNEELEKSMKLYEIDSKEEFYAMFTAQGYDEEFFRDNLLTNKVVQFICENAVVISD